MTADSRTPRFKLDDDGAILRWYHHCTFVGIQDDGTVAGHLPITAEWWTVQQVEPLTVTPSILCRGCGTHGWIRDGQWVPA